MTIKVLITDDHKLFRQGLISLMRTRDDLVTVVGEASSTQEALELVDQHRPDIVLMDIYMPGGDGLQGLRELRQKFPYIAVVILTSSEKDAHLFEAIRLGAAGYLLKNLDSDDLFTMLEGVSHGEVAITRSMAARLLKGISRQARAQVVSEDILTDREVDVLKLVASGMSNPQIAEELFITVNTVKSHLKNILSKLQLDNRTQVAAYAVQAGLVPPVYEQDGENE
jgi:DNA-binding NarL/FixJ family response regulator